MAYVAYQTHKAIYHYCSRRACAPITKFSLKICSKGIRWHYVARQSDSTKEEKGLFSIKEARILTEEHFKKHDIRWLKYFNGVIV